MYRQLPNLLTVFRLVLAALFFFTLNQYRYPADDGGFILLISIVLFVLAALTDVFDGYLARRWHTESTFGRIMDPFCDKVLILGAFIYLAGSRFVIPEAVDERRLFTSVTGVYPWMVAVMLARELLVTGIRGEMEGTGVHFGANLWGKLKMILQSVGVPVILFIVFLDPEAEGRRWLGIGRDMLVYATVLVTLLSGWPYVARAVRTLHQRADEHSEKISG